MLPGLVWELLVLKPKPIQVLSETDYAWSGVNVFIDYYLRKGHMNSQLQWRKGRLRRVLDHFIVGKREESVPERLIKPKQKFTIETNAALFKLS